MLNKALNKCSSLDCVIPLELSVIKQKETFIDGSGFVRVPVVEIEDNSHLNTLSSLDFSIGALRATGSLDMLKPVTMSKQHDLAVADYAQTAYQQAMNYNNVD